MQSYLIILILCGSSWFFPTCTQWHYCDKTFTSSKMQYTSYLPPLWFIHSFIYPFIIHYHPNLSATDRHSLIHPTSYCDQRWTSGPAALQPQLDENNHWRKVTKTFKPNAQGGQNVHWSFPSCEDRSWTPLFSLHVLGESKVSSSVFWTAKVILPETPHHAISHIFIVILWIINTEFIPDPKVFLCQMNHVIYHQGVRNTLRSGRGVFQ